MPAAPADCSKLPRIIVLPVDQVRPVADLLRFFQTDAVLSLDDSALCSLELEAYPERPRFSKASVGQSFPEDTWDANGVSENGRLSDACRATCVTPLKD